MGFPLHGEEADIGGQILYSSDWNKRNETSKQGSVNRPSVQPSKGARPTTTSLSSFIFILRLTHDGILCLWKYRPFIFKLQNDNREVVMVGHEVVFFSAPGLDA